MGYPAIDSDTLAAYELDEQLSDLVFASEQSTTGRGLDNYNGPTFHTHYGSWGPFVEKVANAGNGWLYDTSPGSTNHFNVGVPALFVPARGMGFFEGTASADRDYLVLNGPTANLRTMSCWVQPFQGVGATQIILQKAYQSDIPTDGTPPGTFAAPFYGAMQFFVSSSNDGSWGASINTAGSVTTLTITGNTTERVRLRYSQWNHVGCTYDGATFSVYCNGLLAGSTAVTGSIDYGSGRWVAGAQSDSTISQLNGLIKRIRWEKVVKPLSYFFDCYTNAGGAGPGTPPVIS